MASKKMHPIFKRLALFLLLMIAVNAGITWYFNHVSIRNHKLLKQDRRFHSAPDDIDILVMGHSRPAAALNDSMLPNAASFCSGGESNIHTYYKLKYVLEESGKDVKTVVLPAGFGSINLPDVEVNANSFYWKRYVDYLQLGQEADDFSTYLSVWLKAHVVPWYEYPYLRMQVALGDFNLSVDKEAYANGSDAYKLATAFKIIDQQQASKIPYHPVAINYVQKTIDLCAQHQVRLVYVKYPVSSYYEDAANEAIENNDLHELEARVDSIISNSNTAELLDLRDWEVFNDDDRFSDPQHMTKEARKLFTINFPALLE